MLCVIIKRVIYMNGKNKIKLKTNKSVDKRKLYIRIVAGICALLMLGSVFSTLIFM